MSVSLTVLLWNSITTKTLISQTGLRISLWKFQKTLPIHKPVKIGLKEAVLDDAIANRDNCIKIVVFHLIVFPVCGSLSEFPTN